MERWNEIYTRVCATLVDALNIEEEDISPEATLMGDLGAESIDFLDITFRLEREFGIGIDREELFPASIFGGDGMFVSNGKLTESGVEEVRRSMPFMDVARFRGDVELPAIGDLYTVRMMTRYVISKLESK